MSHLYTCHFCNEIACDVSIYSIHSKIGGIGYDYYSCGSCGIKYVIHHDKERTLEVTKKPREYYWNKVHNKYFDVESNPKKYKEEIKLAEEKRKNEAKEWETSRIGKIWKEAFEKSRSSKFCEGQK